MTELMIELWLILAGLFLWVVGGMLIYATSHGRTMRRLEKWREMMEKYPSEYPVNRGDKK